MLCAAQADRQSMNTEAAQINARLLEAVALAGLCNFAPWRWAFQSHTKKWRKEAVTRHIALQELRQALSSIGPRLDWTIDPDQIAIYERFVDSFNCARKCEKIWSNVAYAPVDRFRARSSAMLAIERKQARLEYDVPSALPVSANGLASSIPVFRSANGSNIFVFPGFFLVSKGDRLGLIDLSTVNCHSHTVQFHEEEGVPKDAIHSGSAYKFSNKDGTPDLRFRDNYLLPVCEYLVLTLESETGLHEQFMFSSTTASLSLSGAIEDLCRTGPA